jgi:hypothetical protein
MSNTPDKKQSYQRVKPATLIKQDNQVLKALEELGPGFISAYKLVRETGLPGTAVKRALIRLVAFGSAEIGRNMHGNNHWRFVPKKERKPPKPKRLRRPPINYGPPPR